MFKAFNLPKRLLTLLLTQNKKSRVIIIFSSHFVIEKQCFVAGVCQKAEQVTTKMIFTEVFSHPWQVSMSVYKKHLRIISKKYIWDQLKSILRQQIGLYFRPFHFLD